MRYREKKFFASDIELNFNELILETLLLFLHFILCTKVYTTAVYVQAHEQTKVFAHSQQAPTVCVLVCVHTYTLVSKTHTPLDVEC